MSDFPPVILVQLLQAKDMWRPATPFNNQTTCLSASQRRSTRRLPTLPPSAPLRASTMQQPIKHRVSTQPTNQRITTVAPPANQRAEPPCPGA